MDEAMTTTRRLLQLNPNNTAANRELAISFYFLGRWEDALRQLEVAERLNPLDAANMWRLDDSAATALVALHRYDEAIERARRGAATNPSNLVPLVVMTSAEAHRNNLVAARQHAPRSQAPALATGSGRATGPVVARKRQLCRTGVGTPCGEGLRLAGPARARRLPPLLP
jgi:tetratricopeptide (TPR) repeat protein